MNNTNVTPLLSFNKNSLKNPLTNSLPEYYDITKKHIYKYILVKFNKKFRNYLMSNDDLFADLVTTVMLADSVHNSNFSSKTYWRTKCCMWTINKTFYHNKNRPMTGNFDNLSDNKTPESEYLKQEEEKRNDKFIKSFIENDTISFKRQHRLILKHFFINNMSQQQIAKLFGVSQPRIHQIISSSLKKIKNEINLETE